MAERRGMAIELSATQRAVLWLMGHYGAARLLHAARFGWRVDAGALVIETKAPVEYRMAERRLITPAEGIRYWDLTIFGSSIASAIGQQPALVALTDQTASTFWLSPAQMEEIAPVLPRRTGVVRHNDRRVLSGIIHVLQRRLSWTEAPKCYGDPGLLRMRFGQWAASGVMDQVLARLMEMRAGCLRLVVTEDTLLRHPSAARHAARGCFPIMVAAEGRA
ncbi:transposase [Gluconacetobacter azotocaptans]|uniref:transposase n=1 Tax=Gluconacetobacter azotocaptans TaxID=142834 RepID=UPI00195D7417|nr:transposase [Gluconacetobacter azotocaptans]MBM9400356.1 transposase [Gluconacetobacter azotocaptans]